MKNKEFCTATNTALARFGLSDTPPLISGATDTGNEDHRRNCLAWHLLCSKTRAEIDTWLKKQKVVLAIDMRVRLNLLREQVREMRERAQA